MEHALALRHFSAGSVALGTFDSLTFGVPLGFYYLVASTGQGAYSLSQSEYEQATRELAPALLLGTLYAGGKGLRALSQSRGGGTHLPQRAQAMEQHLRGLQELARQVETKLGVDGLRELAGWIRERREVGHFVAVGGADAALALHEARGNVAQAQAMMSRARPGPTGSPVAGSTAHKGSGQVAPVADDAARASHEAGAAERAGAWPRWWTRGRASRWRWWRPGWRWWSWRPRARVCPGMWRCWRSTAPPQTLRCPEARATRGGGSTSPTMRGVCGEIKQGKAAEAPLHWAPYERMRGWFARGLAFERLMVELLEADAKLPRADRRFLGAFFKPRISRSVGVWKQESGLRYADVLVIEVGGPAGGPPRVETFSFKSRDLSGLEKEALKAQMIEDASEALQKYGGTLDIRRDSLQRFLRGGSEVSVQRVRLVYEGGELKPHESSEPGCGGGQSRKQGFGSGGAVPMKWLEVHDLKPEDSLSAHFHRHLRLTRDMGARAGALVPSTRGACRRMDARCRQRKAAAKIRPHRPLASAGGAA